MTGLSEFLAARDLTYSIPLNEWDMGRQALLALAYRPYHVIVPGLQGCSTDIMRWCNDHLVERLDVLYTIRVVSIESPSHSHGMLYGFTNAHDAVLFKLRWGSGV